ncbi:MAG: hypothetical protein COC17_01165 [Hyphomicrobiales bacterium]|nr:TerB family tellurite resistance protein [Hyphomicrobiales bacterium]PCH51715.1 MAG: hypothetical protein COC17_01165 [Hyphomicrobiales bacterium]
MTDNWMDNFNRFLGANPSVLKVSDDLQLTSELILLVRMMFADGELKEQEKEVFKRLCISTFGIEEKDIPEVIQYLKDFGYETSSWDAAAMFAELPIERKRTLLVHMLEIAKSDDELHRNEVELIRRTAQNLGLTADDITNEITLARNS